VDSGGEFYLSDKMQTQRILHWARGKELRLVCITPQTGYRAAAARIRLYALPDGLPLLRVPHFGGRSFGNWYEEGGSLMGIYAAPDSSLAGAAKAADRWAQSVAWAGGDTLIYTMAVYQFGLYPSHYNTHFTNPFTSDVVGTIVLACEKYGLHFVGEFHPEARELYSPAYGELPLEAGSIPPNISVSKNGEPGNKLLTPLYPRNRQWYVGMIHEFAELYKDSPAFSGVSLRLMSWVNPGLNNFHSSDWGYDDYTVNRFAKDSGLNIPGQAGDPQRFERRYQWLKENAWERWLDWRCSQVTQLHKQIAEDVRAIRSDLKVYVQGDFDDLRGAGIDPHALSQIPGVVLLGGSFYGRRERSLDGNYRQRDKLIDPEKLKKLCPDGKGGSFLFSAGYFEATEAVVPPESIGFTPQTKIPLRWGKRIHARAASVA
jgi:hypothetical protein